MEHVTDSSVAEKGSATSVTRLYVGLDVHKDPIAITFARRSLKFDEILVEDRGTNPNHLAKLTKVLKTLEGEFDRPLHVVYEAGPRRLRDGGRRYELVASTAITKKPSDHVKTDRRDAEALARLSTAGLLGPL